MNPKATDSKGRNWQWLVYFGSMLEVELNIPTLVVIMRRIIKILTEGGDLKEGKELGEKMWKEAEIVYNGLMMSANDPKLSEQQRAKFEDLAGIIEEFQHLMIKELGVTL